MSALLHQIVLLAEGLGLDGHGELSKDEAELLADAHASEVAISTEEIEGAREAILRGEDPLGALFYELRDADERRSSGSVFTPPEIVKPMVAWAFEQHPARVVDAGCGSGRYAAAIATIDPSMPIIAIDLEPIATLTCRAVLSVVGALNATVIHTDYTKVRIASISGKTAFIGNPPYLRHHQIPVTSKAWAQKAAIALGHQISGLAGLHAYFYLATAHLGRAGDVGCFVTSAEWLDVNYGSIIRNLLTDDLGGREVHIIEPTATPFEGTATTAAIVEFEIGRVVESIGFRSVLNIDSLAPLAPSVSPVSRDRLLEAGRWSVFIKTRTQVPAGYIELGELARVHRGTVTGSNATWVLREVSNLPDRVLFRTVTRARELFAAGKSLDTLDHLRHVVNIPADLGEFDLGERKLIDAFLKQARKADVHRGYVAQARRAWWAVNLGKPAPILATYMARRPPAFVRNIAGARHINIAHGLHPRQELSERQMTNLAASLSASVDLSQGRTYAGGLTKFEPREMERLPVPDLATLSLDASELPAQVGRATSQG